MLGGERPPAAAGPVTAQGVLALLNEAVYAPNDGLREPWRFIYADGGEAAARLRALSGNESGAQRPARAAAQPAPDIAYL